MLVLWDMEEHHHFGSDKQLEEFMNIRFLLIIYLLVIITNNVTYAQSSKNPLLDSNAINESISSMLPTEDFLLGNRDLRKYRPNPKYLRYKSIFRATFFAGEENRPMAIEVAQKYSGEFNIIFKMTTGSFEKVNNMVYPSSDGVKTILVDTFSKTTIKKIDTLFNNLASFAPAKISTMGTCLYRIEFRDVLNAYYFENTIFCSNGDINHKEIIGMLKNITKDISVTKTLKNTLFESWANH